MACEFTENTIPLKGNTEYTGHLTGFGDVVTYSFSMTENETITFNVGLVNDVGGSLPNGTLTLFRLIDGDWVNLGTSFLEQQRNRFNYDGVVGDYFFCLDNLYASTYELFVEFTDYNGIIFDRMYSYSGESADAEWPPIVVPDCNQRVAFSIQKGKLPLDITNLPEDFTFESSGIIYGTAGEQDCESEDYEVPSWNWKKYNQTDGIIATAKEYPVTFRAYFVDYPWVYVEKIYSVCVHNNWDYDEPDILNLQRTEYDVTYIQVPIEDQSPLCPPCTEEERIVTERIVKWKQYDITGFLEQLDKMLFEKQCKERHKIPDEGDIYNEPEYSPEVIKLCPICPNDK